MNENIMPAAILLSVFLAGLARQAAAAPLHYWNFDQAAGNYSDVADGSNAAVPGPGIVRTNGLVGSGAMLLNNVSNCYATAGATGYSVSNGITVEALIRWSPATGWSASADVDTVVRKEEGANRILLAFQPNGAEADTLAWGLNVGGNQRELDLPLDGADGRPTLDEATNGTHHIAATYDKATGLKALYWDGVLLYSSNYAAGAFIDTSGTNQSFTIGNVNPNNSEAFSGLLDEVAFYDYALTSAEIGAHYTNAQGGSGYFYIPAPVALPATNVATTSFHANWQAVTGATNYFLDVALDSSFAFLLGGYSNLAAGSVLTYAVTGLSGGGIYHYRVRAQSPDGFSSANSGTVSVETPYVALSPVHYWNFDQDAGNFPDIADGSNAAAPGPGVARTNGLVGSGAIYLNNVSNCYALAGSAGYTVTNGITVEALVRWTPAAGWSATSADYETIARKEEGAKRILLAFQPNGAATDTLAWGLNVGGTQSELDMPLDGLAGRPSLAQASNGVHHVVATYDKASGIKAIYWDGTLVYSVSFAAGSVIDTSGSANQFTIGNSTANNTESFNGSLDEIVFYDQALSAAEVADHFANAQQGFGYFSAPEPEILAVARSAGGAVSLTVSNMVVASTNRVTSSSGPPWTWTTSATYVATGLVHTVAAPATNTVEWLRIETQR
jgi:hypothetical protein